MAGLCWIKLKQNVTIVLLAIACTATLNGEHVLSKFRYNIADSIIANELLDSGSVDDIIKSEKLSIWLDPPTGDISGYNNTFKRISSLWKTLNSQEIDDDFSKKEIALLLLQRGMILRGKNQSEAALTWFKKAAMDRPDWGDPWFMMGSIYQEDKKIVEALGAYEQALSKSSFQFIQKGDIYLRSSDIYIKLGRREQGFRYLLEASRHKFSNQTVRAHALYRLAMEQWYFQESKSDVIATLQEAVELNPQHYWAWYTLGRLYFDDHLFLEAILATEKATKIEPRNSAAYLVLAQIYENSLESLKACQVYERILQFNPKDEISIQKHSECINLGLE